MFELTADNVIDYLRRRGRLPDGAARAVELADGVSNAVLRIDTATGSFIVKQSRPQLRTRDAWFSDVARIRRERDAMRLLAPLLPSGSIPAVLFDDDADYWFAMTHAPEPFRNWRTVLLGGEVDPSLGEQAGRLLGRMHERSRGASLDAFDDRTIFEQLRVDPFYVRIQERRPEIADAVAPLIERCRSLRLGMCHGDFSPKNLLVHADGLTLVDYETCHHGDVAFDLGFFTSHLMLKSIHLPERRAAFYGLIEAFWVGYRAESPQADELLAAGLQHLGACLLARVDGTSPAPYLTDDSARDRVRRLAVRILRERPMTWGEAFQLASE